MRIINKSTLQFLSLSQSEIETQCKDILHAYHRTPESLAPELLEDLEIYKRKEVLFLDEVDSFDENGCFTPETDVNGLMELFKSDNVFKYRVMKELNLIK